MTGDKPGTGRADRPSSLDYNGKKKKSTKIVFLLAQRRKPSEFKDFIGVYHKRRSTGHWPDLLSA